MENPQNTVDCRSDLNSTEKDADLERIPDFRKKQKADTTKTCF